MADVQIQQEPGRSGLGWVWAIVVILLIAVIAWFLLAGGVTRHTTHTVDVNVQTPNGGTSGSATSSGTSGGTSGAATKPHP